jgi:hypothetical protein
MKHATKVALVLIALVAALALSACGGSGGDSSSGTNETDRTSGSTENDSGGGKKSDGEPVTTIVVRNGEPVGGIQKLEYDAGEEIRFKVSSDAAEEIHVHGYDIAKDVPAGGTVEFDFPAELEGIFEAELEGLGVQILELQVNP